MILINYFAKIELHSVFLISRWFIALVVCTVKFKIIQFYFKLLVLSTSWIVNLTITEYFVIFHYLGHRWAQHRSYLVVKYIILQDFSPNTLGEIYLLLLFLFFVHTMLRTNIFHDKQIRRCRLAFIAHQTWSPR